ncbi:MAG: GGDEF domain-containing protein [Pirellulaceae bacterium]|nr:GGDEF domain-containing protein [Planctomycetales bacterium]
MLVSREGAGRARDYQHDMGAAAAIAGREGGRRGFSRRGWMVMASLTMDVVTTIGTGIVIGALLIIGGLLIGVWLGRRGNAAETNQQLRAHELLEMIRALSSWTHGMAGEVTQYETHLRSLLAGSSEPGGTGESPWLEEILKSNEQLRVRLQESERLLDEKAKEVDSYLSEARTDTLTGLPNRRAFDAELARRFAQWQRYGTPLSIAIVDVDHFKKFNDTYGHLAGDFVLASVARALADTVRDSDMVARLGGEEFAIVMPSTAIADGAHAARRFCEAIRGKTWEFEGIALKVTVSVGVAQAIDSDLAASLVKRSDQAMYAAKETGRNRAYFHDGVTSQPVGDSPARLSAASRSGVPAHLESVCDGLRERLIEVTRK